MRPDQTEPTAMLARAGGRLLWSRRMEMRSAGGLGCAAWKKGIRQGCAGLRTGGKEWVFGLDGNGNRGSEEGTSAMGV